MNDLTQSELAEQFSDLSTEAFRNIYPADLTEDARRIYYAEKTKRDNAVANRTLPAEQHTVSQPSGSVGPTIIQALIWGFMAAAWGAVFLWMGDFASDPQRSPPVPDTLHGTSSTMEMYTYAERVLASASATLAHDEEFLRILGFAVWGLCFLAFAAALVFAGRTRNIDIAASRRLRVARLVLCVVAVAPIVLTTTVKFKESSLLHSAPILERIANPNTDPPIILPGQDVIIDMPTSLQSYRGHYSNRGVSVKHCTAELLDGTTISLTSLNPSIRGHDSEEPLGKTDVMPIMSNVTIDLHAALPSESRLSGALVKLSMAGTLGTIDRGDKYYSSSAFDASTSFRVAGKEEGDFYARHSRITSTIANYVLISLIASVISILTVFALPFLRWMRE